jgi:hypothetical protein
MPVRAQPLSLGLGGFGLLLAALGGACSSSEVDSERVSQARFPERFAQIWCQSLAPCCAPAEVRYDPATCQAQALNYARALLASRVSGEVTYSEAAGTQCLARLERALTNCELEEASSACSLIFVGPSADGTACSNGSACASGYCALGAVALSGVCSEASYRAPSPGKLGEPCVGSCGVPGSFQCPTSLLPSSEGTATYCYAEDGLYCSFDSDSLAALSCQPYAAIGAACSDAESRCVPGAFCVAGSCVAQQASGPCLDAPELCDAQSFCDTSQQCQTKKANGAACLAGEECLSNSCSSDGQSDGICDSGNTLLARACAGVL